MILDDHYFLAWHILGNVKYDVGVIRIKNELARADLSNTHNPVESIQEVLRNLVHVSLAPVMHLVIKQVEDSNLVRVVADNQLVLVTVSTQRNILTDAW